MSEITHKSKAHGHDHDHGHGHGHDHAHAHCDSHSHCHCHDHGHGHDHDHEHHHHGHGGPMAFVAPAVSFAMLVAGMLMNHFGVSFFAGNRTMQLAWYIVAFLPVGIPVIREAIGGLAHKDFFNEFTLMVIACIGAFFIGEYPEAVGVMLFYSVGETLQHGAVERATRDISKLLDVRGEQAHLVQPDGTVTDVRPETVAVGDIVEVRPGERVPLDGHLTGADGLFDTSALTGESVPRFVTDGGEALAGMISQSKTVRIAVDKVFSDSALSRILKLVNEAQGRKAHAELFIRRFARIYTPVVIALAVLVVAVPALVSLFVPSFHFVFCDWLYRALVFLVISCPCALVISVPLGYFAGIGAASRAGILFKGGNYLDAILRVNVVAFDKTGTLTTGKFSVTTVESDGIDRDEMLALMAAAESSSSHPLARALVDYVKNLGLAVPQAESMTEKAGFGTKARVSGRSVIAGNLRMLEVASIGYPEAVSKVRGTVIACAVDGRYAGYAVLSDTLKDDALEAVDGLRRKGIDRVVMLSGDNRDIVEDYAQKLGIKEYHGALLPQDKAAFVERETAVDGQTVAFVGDGMNDAPVLALSSVGVAMGALGSDAAIESADVVIQTDRPSRLVTAIEIGRYTRRIVMQNIVGAIAVKVVVLALGAAGYASLWAAVFADVGVALLAVLNSMRILWFSPRD